MNWAWQLHLKPTIKFVLMALADAADDEGNCWPSVPTLSHKTCMDERSVQRILKTLRDNSFIEVQARFRNDGSPTSNKYRLAMKSTGDKLSPLQRQENHQVVTAIPPLGGNAVTLTTTEPSLNTSSKPLPPNNEVDKSIKGFSSGSNSEFFYPKQLTLKERELAKVQLAPVDEKAGQEILDELAARLNANSIKSSPLAYLRSLITRAQAGQFTPEAGVRIALAREQALIEKSKVQSSILTPTDPKDLPKYLSAMHKALGRKQQPEEQE